MKKSSRPFIALALASMFAAGSLFAADKAAAKVAGCCSKAQGEGKACTHACCVEATKAGDNCTKCGGAGKLEKKAEAKK